MSGHDTLRKDGGWTVELINEIKLGQKTYATIDIKPLKFDNVIRWGDGRIPSILSLLAELSNVPEIALKELTYPDVDRVMQALVSILPPAIREDVEKGARPVATPEEEKTQDQKNDEMLTGDPVDPRFPKVDGLVERMNPEVLKQFEESHQNIHQEGGINVTQHPAAAKVG